jgi:ketosteroid isomerase-like protein
MSRENVEALKRAVEAATRRDVEALLQELHPEVEWHSGILMPLRGEATVYRGHECVPEMFRDFYDVFSDIRVDLSEVRDLGDRVVAIGRIRTRGKESGVETESPWGYVAEFEDGKAISIRTYLDPEEALAAARLQQHD